MLEQHTSARHGGVGAGVRAGMRVEVHSSGQPLADFGPQVSLPHPSPEQSWRGCPSDMHAEELALSLPGQSRRANTGGTGEGMQTGSPALLPPRLRSWSQ